LKSKGKTEMALYLYKGKVDDIPASSLDAGLRKHDSSPVHKKKKKKINIIT